MAHTQLHMKFRMKICDHKTLRMTMQTEVMQHVLKSILHCVSKASYCEIHLNTKATRKDKNKVA